MTKDPQTWRQRIEAARSEGLAAREYFVVFSDPAGDKDKVRETLKIHLDYQRDLESRGVLLAAGPLSDEKGEAWTGRGMIILRAASLDESRAIADADPMHASGARNYTLLPWLMNEGSFSLVVKLAGQKVDFA